MIECLMYAAINESGSGTMKQCKYMGVAAASCLTSVLIVFCMKQLWLIQIALIYWMISKSKVIDISQGWHVSTEWHADVFSLVILY